MTANLAIKFALKNPTHYETFIPLDEKFYDCPDPRYTDPRDGFLITIPIYAAVPLGVEDYSVTVPDLEFCTLGAIYGHTFILIDTIKKRLDPGWEAVYRSDYDTWKLGKKPFPIWNSDGTFAFIPSTLFVNTSKSFDDWKRAQYTKWVQIAGVLNEAKPPVPFNVYSRFPQPGADTLELIFTPSDKAPLFGVAELEAIFAQAFADETLDLPPYRYRVIEWTEASGNFQLVGGEFLSCLWIG